MLNVICFPVPMEAVYRIARGIQSVLVRRVEPKQPFDRIWLFVKTPVPTVMMECSYSQVVTLPKPDLWPIAFDASGMKPFQWASYFQGRATGTAIFLQDAILLPPSQRFDPVKRLGLKQAPQMHVYTQVCDYPFGRPLYKPEVSTNGLFTDPTAYPD